MVFVRVGVEIGVDVGGVISVPTSNFLGEADDGVALQVLTEGGGVALNGLGDCA